MLQAFNPLQEVEIFRLGRLLAVGVIAIALCLFAVVRPAMAADAKTLEQGAKVFSANCAACHMNGNNVVNASKNLKLETLKQYDMASMDAIVNQVTNGKSVMPAFKTSLSAEQIQAVASYVLDRAEHGWSS